MKKAIFMLIFGALVFCAWPFIEKEYYIFTVGDDSLSSKDYYWGNDIYYGRTFSVRTLDGILSSYRTVGKDVRIKKKLMLYEYNRDISSNDEENRKVARNCISNNDIKCLNNIGKIHQLTIGGDLLAEKYYSIVNKYGGTLDYFQRAFLEIEEPQPVSASEIEIDYSYGDDCASCISTQEVEFKYDSSKSPSYCHMKAYEVKGIKKIRSIFLWVGIEEKKKYTHDIPLLNLNISASGGFAMLGAGETTEITLSPPYVEWTATRNNIKKTGSGLLKAKMACAASWSNHKYRELKSKGSQDPKDYLNIIKTAGLLSRGSINAAYTAVHLSEKKEEYLRLIEQYSTRFSENISSQADDLTASMNKDYSRSNPLANAIVDTMSSLCRNGGCDDLDNPKHEEAKRTCQAVMRLSGKSSGGASGSCFLETKHSLASWKCKYDYMANKGKTYGEASGACWLESGRYE